MIELNVNVTLSHLESSNVEFYFLGCFDISIVICILDAMPHCNYVKPMIILKNLCETPTFLNDSY